MYHIGKLSCKYQILEKIFFLYKNMYCGPTRGRGHGLKKYFCPISKCLQVNATFSGSMSLDRRILKIPLLYVSNPSAAGFKKSG
jgi:hypothetical protein